MIWPTIETFAINPFNVVVIREFGLEDSNVRKHYKLVDFEEGD